MCSFNNYLSMAMPHTNGLVRLCANSRGRNKHMSRT